MIGQVMLSCVKRQTVPEPRCCRSECSIAKRTSCATVPWRTLIQVNSSVVRKYGTTQWSYVKRMPVRLLLSPTRCYTDSLTTSSTDKMEARSRRDWSSAVVTSPSDRDVMTDAHSLQRTRRVTSEGLGCVTCGVTSHSTHNVRELWRTMTSFSGQWWSVVADFWYERTSIDRFLYTIHRRAIVC